MLVHFGGAFGSVKSRDFVFGLCALRDVSGHDNKSAQTKTTTRDRLQKQKETRLVVSGFYFGCLVCFLAALFFVVAIECAKNTL